jgi:adenosylmethionine-8-amino-7-oxononanoate aminotransferase
MSSGQAIDTSKVMVDFNQMKAFGQDPLVLERGEGIYVWDVFGKRYIDGLSGVFTVNYGHGVESLIDVAAEQARQIAFTAPTMATNPPALRLADLLIQITPPQYTTVKFFSGGSEATEGAIKMARQFHAQTGNGRKFKIISRWLSYHGGTGFAAAASGQKDWKSAAEPYAGGFIHVEPPARPGCAACQRASACTGACIDIIEAAIEREDPATVAAVIAEPIMVSAGFQVPPADYFPRLREVCDRHNVVLIHDEIITGFGRTGNLFGSETVGAWPDIIACGKGISGGYAPLSAILVSDKIASAFWGEPEAGVQFWSGHTYGGNPVACAVGEAAVRMLIDQDIVANVRLVGDRIAANLRDLQAKYPVIDDVRGVGMLQGIGFSEPIGRRVYLAARKRGILLRPGASFVGLAPPLVTTLEQADECTNLLDLAIQDVLNG